MPAPCCSSKKKKIRLWKNQASDDLCQLRSDALTLLSLEMMPQVRLTRSVPPLLPESLRDLFVKRDSPCVGSLCLQVWLPPVGRAYLWKSRLTRAWHILDLCLYTEQVHGWPSVEWLSRLQMILSWNLCRLWKDCWDTETTVIRKPEKSHWMCIDVPSFDL